MKLALSLRQSYGRIGVLIPLFVLFGGIYTFSTWQAAQAQTQDTELETELREVLAPSTTSTSNIRTIDSSLGFKLTYNKTSLVGQGQVTDAVPTDSKFTVTGTTYSDDELNERRDYSIVKFRPVETGEQEFQSYPVELTVLTNIRAGYWDNKVNLSKYRGMSKLDIWIAETSKQKLDSGYLAEEAKERKINGVDYKEVTYTYEITGELPYKTSDRFYFTVQNDRPYYAAIYNIKDGEELVAEYEAVIKTITYEGVNNESLASENLDGDLQAASDSLSSTSNIPQGFSADGLLDVVAKNQIAVVRVGTVNCMDLDLVLPSGTTVTTIQNACAAGIGSGSIITSDGYVATNGHVVRTTKYDALSAYLLLSASPDDLANRVQPILDYFIAKGELTREKSKLFTDAVRKKDSQAVQRSYGLGSLFKDKELVAKNETPSYYIQLSNVPIRIDTTVAKLTIGSDNTIVQASLVGDNYELIGDDGRINFNTLKGTDVALLKMEGNFPVVDLGNILNVKESDRLTAIGYPGFVDGGLQTTRDKTVPSITQGYVESVEPQVADSQYKLIITSVPLAQGNSGGPSFDDAGVQIGLNTYSILPCSDGKCFGNGIIRDIDDLKQLAAVKGVQFGKTGGITETWRKGIDSFKATNYVQAAKQFNKVSQEYSDHYLANAMRSLAEEKAGVPINYNERPAGLIIGGIAGTIVLVIAGITIVVLLRRHHGRRMDVMHSNPSYQAPYPTPMLASMPTPPAQPVPMAPLPVAGPAQEAPLPVVSSVATPQLPINQFTQVTVAPVPISAVTPSQQLTITPPTQVPLPQTSTVIAPTIIQPQENSKL